jgi:hypothetical protein
MSFRIRRSGLSATALLAVAALGLTAVGCGRFSSGGGGNVERSGVSFGKRVEHCAGGG